MIYQLRFYKYYKYRSSDKQDKYFLLQIVFAEMYWLTHSRLIIFRKKISTRKGKCNEQKSTRTDRFTPGLVSGYVPACSREIVNWSDWGRLRFSSSRTLSRKRTKGDVSRAGERKLFRISCVHAIEWVARALNVALHKRKASTRAETRGLLISTLAAHVTSARHPPTAYRPAVSPWFFVFLSNERQSRMIRMWREFLSTTRVKVPPSLELIFIIIS